MQSGDEIIKEEKKWMIGREKSKFLFSWKFPTTTFIEELTCTYVQH